MNDIDYAKISKESVTMLWDLLKNEENIPTMLPLYINPNIADGFLEVHNNILLRFAYTYDLYRTAMGGYHVFIYRFDVRIKETVEQFYIDFMINVDKANYNGVMKAAKQCIKKIADYIKENYCRIPKEHWVSYTQLRQAEDKDLPLRMAELMYEMGY